jgi:hypothetical protein
MNNDFFDIYHECGPNKPSLHGLGFPLHRPERNLALWFNSSLNDLESAMLVERDIFGDKGFQIAKETLLISPLENGG